MTNDGRTLRTTAGQDDFALHSSHCPTCQFFKKGSNSMQQNQRYFFLEWNCMWCVDCVRRLCFVDDPASFGRCQTNVQNLWILVWRLFIIRFESMWRKLWRFPMQEKRQKMAGRWEMALKSRRNLGKTGVSAGMDLCDITWGQIRLHTHSCWFEKSFEMEVDGTDTSYG